MAKLFLRYWRIITNTDRAQAYCLIYEKTAMGELSMDENRAKELAHELAMEYIKEKKMLSNPILDNIPNMVDKFADINKSFYDAIINNNTLGDLY